MEATGAGDLRFYKSETAQITKVDWSFLNADMEQMDIQISLFENVEFTASSWTA